jgi:hypoxanthine-guanine phosphoribosyltransferase
MVMYKFYVFGFGIDTFQYIKNIGYVFGFGIDTFQYIKNIG